MPDLTDREEAIAQRAAEIAIEKVAAQIGKSVVQKLFWIVGTVALGLFAYFGGFHK
jgi:hypothetical protein